MRPPPKRRRACVLTASPCLHCPRWVDAGKVLTGVSAVGSSAIPAILAHAQVGPRHVGAAGRCSCAQLLVPRSCNRSDRLAPSIAQVITTGALMMELAAVVVLGATFVVYDYYASKDAY